MKTQTSKPNIEVYEEVDLTESKDTTKHLSRPKTACEKKYCSIRNNKIQVIKSVKIG